MTLTATLITRTRMFTLRPADVLISPAYSDSPPNTFPYTPRTKGASDA